MVHLLEAWCKAQEEAHKEKEEDCKDREEEFKAHFQLFNEWEHIQMNIWQLGNALNTGTKELLKHDFQSDIIALINRNKRLANKLNFN